MDIDHAAIAKEVISRIRYVTIATASKEAVPWNTPVTAAFDEHYNFFWTSWVGTQHSQNIRDNPAIFIVIFDSTSPVGVGGCVYIQAKAMELIDQSEIDHAAAHVYQRKNKTPRPSEEFLGESPRRMYKAVPEKVWISMEEDVKKDFTNTRREISLI